VIGEDLWDRLLLLILVLGEARVNCDGRFWRLCLVLRVEMSDADEVVGSGGEGEVPVEFWASPVACLA